MIQANDMEKIQYIVSEIEKTVNNSDDIKEVIIALKEKGFIDEKAVRNKKIIIDYNTMLRNRRISVTTIVDDLSYKYEISCDMIKKIIYSR